MFAMWVGLSLFPMIIEERARTGGWLVFFIVLLAISAAWFLVDAWLQCSATAIVLTPDEVVGQRHLWLWWVTRRRMKRSEVQRVDLDLNESSGIEEPTRTVDFSASDICIYTGQVGRSVKFGYYLTIEEKKWLLLEIAHYIRAPVGASFFDKA